MTTEEGLVSIEQRLVVGGRANVPPLEEPQAAKAELLAKPQITKQSIKIFILFIFCIFIIFYYFTFCY